jgi:hypothetical protein
VEDLTRLQDLEGEAKGKGTASAVVRRKRVKNDTCKEIVSVINSNS